MLGRSGHRVAVLVDLHAQDRPICARISLISFRLLAAEVLGLEHFGFGLLHQFADGLNVGVLEAVVAADRELQLFYRAVEVFVAEQRASFFATCVGFDLLFEVDEDLHVVLEQFGGEADSIGGKHGAVGPHFEGELVVVGDLTETSGFDR